MRFWKLAPKPGCVMADTGWAMSGKRETTRNNSVSPSVFRRLEMHAICHDEVEMGGRPLGRTAGPYDGLPRGQDGDLAL